MEILEDIVDAVIPHSMRHHRVKFPENLATLSKFYYGCTDYAMAIYQANRSSLTDPDSVYPGMVLVIPHIPHTRKK